jgi:hypothetical protein
MPNERSNVEFPMWRKKVSGSMFTTRCTVIPNWVRDDVFRIAERFPHSDGKRPESRTTILIRPRKGRATSHEAWVTTGPRKEKGKRLPDVTRLHYGKDVVAWLEWAFSMTKKREDKRKARGMTTGEAERMMSFWEMLDIEWDVEGNRFIFRDWYSIDGRLGTSGSLSR